eukprot:scpid73832/ scgid10500/ Follistatin-related protein 4; Follistatin-like protein 4; m-D/Bsp120I 1-1
MMRPLLLLALVGAAFSFQTELISQVEFALESNWTVIVPELLPEHPCGFISCESHEACEIDIAKLPKIKPVCRPLTEVIVQPGHTHICLKTLRTEGEELTRESEYEFRCQCMDECPEVELEFQVCGNDGNTYASHCQLHREACRSNRRIVAVHKGSCLDNTNMCPELEVEVNVGQGAAAISCRDPRDICDAKWMVGPSRLLTPAESTERYTVRGRPTGHGSSIVITQLVPEDDGRFKCACADRLPECPVKPAYLESPEVPSMLPSELPAFDEPEQVCQDMVHVEHQHLQFNDPELDVDFRQCRIHNLTARNITFVYFNATNVHISNSSLEIIRIVNSSITNLTLANFTIAKHIEFINSTIMNITFVNTTLLNMTFINATVFNHTFVNATAYNCTYLNTTITNHTFLNSTIYNFTYINSTIFNKTINSTVFKNLTLINSTMVNVTMLNSTITNHTLVNVTAFNLTKWNVTINGSIYSNVTLNNTMWKNVTFLNNISIPLFNNLTNFTLYNATFYNVSLQSINATHFTFINST